MKVTDEHRRMTENRDTEIKHKTHPKQNRTQTTRYKMVLKKVKKIHIIQH